jgi:hypothetical protein
MDAGGLFEVAPGESSVALGGFAEATFKDCHGPAIHCQFQETSW